MINISQKISEYKQKQRIKEIKKTVRKTLHRIFNKKTMTKALILVSSLALIASYILPYMIQ